MNNKAISISLCPTVTSEKKKMEREKLKFCFLSDFHEPRDVALVLFHDTRDSDISREEF